MAGRADAVPAGCSQNGGAIAVLPGVGHRGCAQCCPAWHKATVLGEPVLGRLPPSPRHLQAVLGSGALVHTYPCSQVSRNGYLTTLVHASVAFLQQASGVSLKSPESDAGYLQNARSVLAVVPLAPLLCRKQSSWELQPHTALRLLPAEVASVPCH